MIVNPFDLPGRKNPHGPLDPLNPDRDPAEEDALYLDVDKSEASFRAFQEEFGPPEELDRQGHMVIAAGWEGCGKTALINRCAQWAKAEMERATLVPAIIDLRPDALEHQEISERMRRVCRRMTHVLRARNLLRNSDDFIARYSEPEDAYPTVGDYLQEGVVVVALLPRSELSEELVRYAQLTRRRLLFFAEIRNPRQVEDVERRLQLPSGHMPTVLEVGPLGDGHGWHFCDSRMAGSGVRDNVPAIREETLTRVTGLRDVSIGELQGLLYGVYDEVLRWEKPPPEVIWDDLMNFYFRQANRRNRV
jgi:hypothetical protein